MTRTYETDGAVKNNVANPTNCGHFNVEDQKRNGLVLSVFKNPQLLSPPSVLSANKDAINEIDEVPRKTKKIKEITKKNKTKQVLWN